jgi:hypothetical protein
MSTPYHFCTYFDHRYLPRALALYRSLARHARPFVLYALCMDDEARDTLLGLGLEGLRVISLREFEEGDAALAAARGNRSLIEYYFTCTPSLPLYVLDHFPGIDVVTYLDADLYFYGSPAPLYDELGNGSVLIIGHRFAEHLREREAHGLYNVGYLSFRNDGPGRECLRWWRERCLEWCYDRLEDGRYADQKYLDEWPRRFPGVVVLRHKGANLAPWNVSRYRLRRAAGSVTVDAQPLVFYHFHFLKMVTPSFFHLGLGFYRARLGAVLRRDVYLPYLRELRAVLRQLGGPPARTARKLSASRLRELALLLVYGTPTFFVGKEAVALDLTPALHPLVEFARGLAKGLGLLAVTSSPAGGK